MMTPSNRTSVAVRRGLLSGAVVENVLSHGDFALISAATAGGTVEKDHIRLKQDLAIRGLRFFETVGQWGGVKEPSFFVIGAPPRYMTELAMKYRQEAVIVAEHGRARMIDLKTGKATESSGWEAVGPDEVDNFTQVPIADGSVYRFRLVFP